MILAEVNPDFDGTILGSLPKVVTTAVLLAQEHKVDEDWRKLKSNEQFQIVVVILAWSVGESKNIVNPFPPSLNLAEVSLGGGKTLEDERSMTGNIIGNVEYSKTLDPLILSCIL